MKGIRRHELLLFVGALIVFVLCRRQLDLGDRGSGGPALDDAPTSLYGVFVFGAFKPIFVEQLWAQTEKMEREGRFWEMIDAQARLLRLVPDEPRIWARQSTALAYTVAQNEVEDRLRWRWYRRALAILDQGIALHPDDYELREIRFRIVFNLVSADPYAARQIVPGTGQRGLLAALGLGRELREQFPEEPSATFAFIRVVEESVEYLMNLGRFEEARAVLDEFRGRIFDAPWPHPRDPLRPQLETVYAFGSEALADLAAVADWQTRPPELLDESRLLALLARLADFLERPGLLDLSREVETFDAALLSLIHVRAMHLCQSLLLAKKHEAALRLVPALNRIAALAEGRVDSEMPYYSTAYVEGLRALIALDAEWTDARRSGAESPADLVGRWRAQLQELDRLIRRSSGRSDSFAKRLMDSRR